MNMPENDEGSCVGTGAHERLFVYLRGWPMTPGPKPIPQYPYYHVRPLAVNSRVYSGLPCYSYLTTRATTGMTPNIVMRTSRSRALQQGFLM